MRKEHWWPRFRAAVNHVEWVDDNRFAGLRDRWQNMAELIDLIDSAFATRPLAEWSERFDEHGLIWGPVASVAELAADPQAYVAGVFPEINHPDGSFRTVAAPLAITGADIGPRGPAPRTGSGHRPSPRRDRLLPGTDRRTCRKGSRRSSRVNAEIGKLSAREHRLVTDG